MSAERELLEICLEEFKYNEVRHFDLVTKIMELLAQPEQTEQEPVGFIKYGRSVTWVGKARYLKDGDLLYTLPPKQEPMTDREISQGFRADKDANNAESYWAGVKLAEKHYGVKINE